MAAKERPNRRGKRIDGDLDSMFDDAPPAPRPRPVPQPEPPAGAPAAEQPEDPGQPEAGTPTGEPEGPQEPSGAMPEAVQERTGRPPEAPGRGGQRELAAAVELRRGTPQVDGGEDGWVTIPERLRPFWEYTRAEEQPLFSRQSAVLFSAQTDWCHQVARASSARGVDATDVLRLAVERLMQDHAAGVVDVAHELVELAQQTMTVDPGRKKRGYPMRRPNPPQVATPVMAGPGGAGARRRPAGRRSSA